MKPLTSLAVLATLAITATAHANAPAVFPPNFTPYGKTYAQWGALAWQQVLPIPLKRNPELAANPDHCNLGAGNVRLLVGAQANVRRSCQVPIGSALLLSPIAIECSTLERPPFHGNNPAQLRRCTERWAAPVRHITVRIDGKAVHSVMSYRVESGPFALQIPRHALIPPGRDTACPTAGG
jgi:hypothetical protein